MTVAAQAGGPPGGAVDEGLKREGGFLGLMWASEGSIIGSGGLFWALTATVIAGPAVVFSWVIASAIVILLALIHAELGGIFNVTGGTSRLPHYAFRRPAGASFGWVSTPPAAPAASPTTPSAAWPERPSAGSPTCRRRPSPRSRSSPPSSTSRRSRGPPAGTPARPTP